MNQASHEASFLMLTGTHLLVVDMFTSLNDTVCIMLALHQTALQAFLCALTLGPVVLYRAEARTSPLPSPSLAHAHIAPVLLRLSTLELPDLWSATRIFTHIFSSCNNIVQLFCGIHHLRQSRIFPLLLIRTLFAVVCLI